MSEKQQSPERRYCTSCQTWRIEAGGKAYKRGNTTRWVCLPCSERRTTSLYASKATLAKIEKDRKQNARATKSDIPELKQIGATDI